MWLKFDSQSETQQCKLRCNPENDGHVQPNLVPVLNSLTIDKPILQFIARSSDMAVCAPNVERPFDSRKTLDSDSCVIGNALIEAWAAEKSSPAQADVSTSTRDHCVAPRCRSTRKVVSVRPTNQDEQPCTR
jgi:hypothetical protein